MNQSQMLKLFTDNNFTVEENQITYKTTESTKIRYHCNICKTKFYQMFKDFKRRGAINGCSGCKTLANKNEKKKNYKQKAIEELEESKSDNELEIKQTSDIIDEESKSDNELEIKQTPDIIDEKTGEIWKKIPGGWISSEGKAKNNNGELLTLCKYKNRYTINGKAEYVPRLVAITFKISNYEKLILDNDNQFYCASHINERLIDKKTKKIITVDNSINNIKVITRSEVNRENGKKSRKSQNFKDKCSLKFEEMFNKVESTVIDFLPNHIIFCDGNIYNKTTNKFLTGSKTPENRLHISIDGKNYYIHRLVCFAFNPLPWFSTFEEYENSNLQVNHIDGNTLNNSADNLEWCDQSENMFHAYQTGLNKKCRVVLQYDKDTDELIGEYPSIAEASRKTGDTESQIRTSAKGNGKDVSTAQFIWKHKNSEETIEYTRKYSSKTKKK
jgi:hypothetical protein